MCVLVYLRACVGVGVSGWMWVRVGGCGREWVDVGGCGCEWVDVGVSGGCGCAWGRNCAFVFERVGVHGSVFVGRCYVEYKCRCMFARSCVSKRT